MIKDVVQKIPDTHRAPFRFVHAFKYRFQFGDSTDANFVPVEEVTLQPTKCRIGSIV